jgi:phage portal protein BeeE
MSIFYEFGSWAMGGLKRMLGIQYNTPTYTDEAASPVTFDTAMQLSAVWACVKLLAETPASLPLNFYRKTDSGRVLDAKHDLAVLFAGKVNRYQNRVEFWETVLLNLLMLTLCVGNQVARQETGWILRICVATLLFLAFWFVTSGLVLTL